jgi:hypothetical protein
MEPVPTKFTVIVPKTTQGTAYVDLSQCASILSRKFLRQGLAWAVKGLRVMMPPGKADTYNGVNAFYVSRVPVSWVASNAWHKAQAHWLKQQNDALEESGSESAAARFRDFKIYADRGHATAGELGNLTPISMGPGQATGPWLTPLQIDGGSQVGEWQYSRFVLPNDQIEVKMHAVGGDIANQSVGMIQSYAESRAFPTSPDPEHPGEVDDNFYTDLQNSVFESNQDIIRRATDTNDNLPYNQAAYPGGETNMRNLESVYWHVNQNTIGMRNVSVPGFIAPCGLIRIDWINNPVEQDDLPLTIEIELCQGDHRGYLAQPMQEF